MTTFDETWHGIIGDILTIGHHVGSRNGLCLELLNYQLKLRHIDTVFLLHPLRRMSPQYAAAEILWYLSGKNSINAIQAYAPQYEDFAENGVAFGAYGHRWQYVDVEYPTQLHALVATLRKRQDTRQAVVCMWNSLDLIHAYRGDKKDLPCTLSWQFICRNKRLHMTCTMRSQDAWLGMPYDIFANTMMLRLIAAKLNWGVGTYTHNVGSLHLYKRNWSQAQAVVRAPFNHTQTHGSRWHEFIAEPRLFTDISTALDIETKFRTVGCDTLPMYDLDRMTVPIRDLTLLCISKWRHVNSDLIFSPLLREAYRAHRGR